MPKEKPPNVTLHYGISYVKPLHYTMISDFAKRDNKNNFH